MTQQEHHTQVTAEELAQAFEEEAAPVDLSHHGWEDWLTLALFWVLVACVFLQFFTRYALNNSLAWTEEIAINVLVVVVFMGAAMCVRTSRHIHVDVLYHYLPPRARENICRLRSMSSASASSPMPPGSCGAMCRSLRMSA